MARPQAALPRGGDKGAHPLMFIPALTACTSERMKTEGFRTLRPLLPAPQAQAEDEKNVAKAKFSLLRKATPDLLQFRNKKPLTSVTIGGNI